MTRSRAKRELTQVRHDLQALDALGKLYNRDTFTLRPYSKRRTRLVRTYWALRAIAR